VGFAELLLRLGCSLVAWLVLIGHCLWLSVLGSIGCGLDGAQPWLALLWSTPLTLLFTAVLPLGFAVPGIGRALLAPLLVLAPLLAFAAWIALRSLLAVNLHGEALCAADARWTLLWSPLQLSVLGAMCASLFVVWRRASA
jgi:hypothetical protein